MYELSQLIGTLRRQSRLAVIIFLVLVAIGATAVMLSPRTFETSSDVLVKRPDTQLQSTNYPQIDALLASNRDTAVETYVALARQPAIAEQTIRALGLNTTPSDLLGKSVTVTPLTNADILKISVDWRDPEGSASIANAFARAFLDRQRVLAASQASEAAASLSVALNRAQNDLSNADRALTLFQSQHGLADGNTQTASLLAAIADIQSKERTVEAERMQAQGQLTTVRGQIADAPSTVNATTTIGTAPATDQMQQQLSQQELQLTLLRRQFTEKYPDVIATEKQIASLKAALVRAPQTKVTGTNVEPNPLTTSLTTQAATLQSQINGDLSQLRVLDSQESALSAQLQVYPQFMSDLSTLQRKEKSAETIYDALQSNYFNALVAKNMAVSDLTIVQYADPALATARPPRLPALFAVIAVALLATLGLVFLLDWYAVGSMSLSEAR